MVNIEIDGIPLRVDSSKMIIQVADEAGIDIPRFCYHKKLSIAANCRMCLIEVAQSRKALPACATPVTEGMKIFTQSDTAIAAQRGVMEFLLINHPLDCPICEFLIKGLEDIYMLDKFGCCQECAFTWAQPRRKEWEEGWRPSSQQINDNNTRRLEGIK